MILTLPEQHAREKLCLPLDNLDNLAALRLRVDELKDYVGVFKIGKGSFTRFGPDVVRYVREYGVEVFLDLKFHDIPETVKDASKAAAQTGAYMFNVHAAGGLAMMQAALKGAKDGTRPGYERPKVIAVTILTSLDFAKYIHTHLGLIEGLAHLTGEKSRYHQFVGWAKKFDFATLIREEKEKTDEYKRLKSDWERVQEEYELQKLIPTCVGHLAQLTYQAGLDGIVCSAEDIKDIREHLPANFMYVTPGIQGVNTSAGADQARVASPYGAFKEGSSLLVVGRAITAPPTAQERQHAAHLILQDMVRGF